MTKDNSRRRFIKNVMFSLFAARLRDTCQLCLLDELKYGLKAAQVIWRRKLLALDCRCRSVF